MAEPLPGGGISKEQGRQGDTASVTWDSPFPPEQMDEDPRAMRAIREDMSCWSSRKTTGADAENPGAIKANRLAWEPRRNTVGRRLTG